MLLKSNPIVTQDLNSCCYWLIQAISLLSNWSQFWISWNILLGLYSADWLIKKTVKEKFITSCICIYIYTCISSDHSCFGSEWGRSGFVAYVFIHFCLRKNFDLLQVLNIIPFGCVTWILTPLDLITSILDGVRCVWMGEATGKNPQFGAQLSFNVHYFVPEARCIRRLNSPDSGFLTTVQEFKAELDCSVRDIGANIVSAVFSVRRFGEEFFKSIAHSGPFLIQKYSPSLKYTSNLELNGLGLAKRSSSSVLCHLDRNILWF